MDLQLCLSLLLLKKMNCLQNDGYDTYRLVVQFYKASK